MKVGKEDICVFLRAKATGLALTDRICEGLQLDCAITAAVAAKDSLEKIKDESFKWRTPFNFDERRSQFNRALSAFKAAIAELHNQWGVLDRATVSEKADVDKKKRD